MVPVLIRTFWLDYNLQVNHSSSAAHTQQYDWIQIKQQNISTKLKRSWATMGWEQYAKLVCNNFTPSFLPDEKYWLSPRKYYACSLSFETTPWRHRLFFSQTCALSFFRQNSLSCFPVDLDLFWLNRVLGGSYKLSGNWEESLKKL